MTIIRLRRAGNLYECFDCWIVFRTKYVLSQCPECDSDELYRMK